MEYGLSVKFYKDPYYWRTVPLREVIRIYRNMQYDDERKKKLESHDTRKFYTDKKGKKHVKVSVLSPEEFR